MVIARQFGKLRALHSHWGKSPWFRRALAVVAGAALALAFQKTNLAGLAWVAPALILWAARDGNAFRLGGLAGFTHYLISLSWLLNIPVKFFPILGWLALAGYLALYPAAWACICVRVLGERAGENWLTRTSHALFCAAATRHNIVDEQYSLASNLCTRSACE